jgi:hypothetical protein
VVQMGRKGEPDDWEGLVVVVCTQVEQAHLCAGCWSP